MQQYKLTVVALILVLRMCQSEVNVVPSVSEQSTARLVNDLTKIVTTCYKDIDGVGIVGKLPDSLYKKISARHSIPVALIDDSISDTTVPVQLRRKLNLFIVEFNSNHRLMILIENSLQYSIWWNHMAFFFLVDLSPTCNYAQNGTLFAWQLNMLNAKIICRHDELGTQIFTYNPFISKAPVPWKRFNTVNGIMNQPFVVFVQKYQDNDTICLNLDFDKVKNLNNYTINVEGLALSTIMRHIKNMGRAEYRYFRTMQNVFDNLFRTLNTFALYDRTFKDVKTYVAGDIRNTLIETSLTWEINPSRSGTYPHIFTQVAITTQSRGYKSPLSKILLILNSYSSYGIVIVYSVTLIYFKVFVRQDLVPAVLNLVRMTCNLGFRNMSLNAPSKVYLTFLSFFMITIHCIIKGNLPLMTYNIPHDNVDTQQQLVDWGFERIYCSADWQRSTTHPDLVDKLVMSDYCLAQAKDDRLAACIIIVDSNILDDTKKYNMYMSKEFIREISFGILIRNNWPLEERVNTIISRMVEHGILDSWEGTWDAVSRFDKKINRKVNNDIVNHAVQLSELGFAFVILIIGLAFATVAFIVEFAIQFRYTITLTIGKQRNNKLIQKLLG